VKQQLPVKPAPTGNWVQTEREAHEAWAQLIARAPKAAAVMHLLTARVGENNAVVISHRTLAGLLGVKSLTTVKAALATLADDRWIEIRQIGDRGTVNAYVLNDRVVWSGKRDNIRHSLFSATVVVSSDEQPDADQLGHQTPLRRLPRIGEMQMPHGVGLPPESQPSFDGFEPALPATGDE